MNTAPPRPTGIENAWNMLSGFQLFICCNGRCGPKKGAKIDGRSLSNGGHGTTHDTIYSPLHDDPKICGTCHDEIDPFGQLVKGTYTEWLNSPYSPNTRCQDCHQRDGMGGMGGNMGRYSMNFKGGFSPYVEGVASLSIDAPNSAPRGQMIDFRVTATNEQVGHEFPSGSEEERQLWIHVTATDEAGSSWHIPIAISPNLDDPAEPNHQYWVTTNDEVAWPSPNTDIGEAIPRDSLPEGDRIYHSIFISPAYTGSKITYAQYYAAEIFSNRLKPSEPRVEEYSWKIPDNAVGTLTIRGLRLFDHNNWKSGEASKLPFYF